MLNKEDVAVLIVSFDKYEDIWKTFGECLNLNWSNCPFNTYLITNNKLPAIDGVSVIKTGNEISWSDRVTIALNQINEKVLILLLEDYLIDMKVDNNLLESVLNDFYALDLDYLRIAPIPKLRSSDKESRFIKIDKKNVYGINLQAAIWKKSFLYNVISGGSYSAWEIEARQKTGEPTCINGKCMASKEYIIHYLNGIIQGKWYIKTINELGKQGIVVNTCNREIMSEKDMLRESIRNWFLHHINPKIIYKIKPIAKKIGFKFVTK